MINRRVVVLKSREKELIMAYYKKQPTAFTINGGAPIKKENEDWNKKPKKLTTNEEIDIVEDTVGDENIEDEDTEIQ
jgi:NADPH:quinone reductase-like Zn-dependent oxidoreductase